MNHTGIEMLGWAATAVFVASYFFARPWLLRSAQMVGALLWTTYGVLINSTPVIVANVLVFCAAAWTMFRKAPAQQSAPQPLPLPLPHTAE